jgi:hypothetical protein
MPTASTANVTFDLPTATLDRILSNAEWMLNDGVAQEEVQRWARERIAGCLKVRAVEREKVAA